jgi:hypothetical protein
MLVLQQYILVCEDNESKRSRNRKCQQLENTRISFIHVSSIINTQVTKFNCYISHSAL